ncbi:Metal transporter Nramp2 [Acorus calamus]|uniref:Metal transporter Nramp2 n=1 Tax=Acorus calamus TaxID=4465 RepID=A0AAV9FDT7_ACOCL|nr:Metal transporter Nramp2 [Acorus calamus]
MANPNPPEEENTLLPPSSSPPLTTPAATSSSDDEEETAYETSEKIVVTISSPSDSFDEDLPWRFSWKKLWLFTGPGFLMSIAFLDPGNLEGDLQAGAIAGYSLLWLLMWATAMGFLIQMLAARVGVATGKHLAELCREEYPPWASFIFLFLENYGVRKLEAVFAVLIATMALSFAWMFGETQPSGKDLLLGILIPKLSSKTIHQAVGVVGCVIMPHNVFLHSALVQSRKIDPDKKSHVQEALNYYSIEAALALFISFMINLFVTTVFAKGFYGSDVANSIGLVNAGQYLEEKYGGGVLPILYIWGIGLLAAGQSSTITGTYAGQFIMGGFLNLRLKKWLRALITRSFAIVPTMIVALIFERSDSLLDVLNEWLNVLQSVQIPFALIPLLFLVSKEEVMGVFKIGRTLKTVTWIVAGLLIIINGFLLLDFFSSEVHGLLMGSIVFAVTAVYVAFIVYLIVRGSHLSNQFTSSFKRLTNT